MFQRSTRIGIVVAFVGLTTAALLGRVVRADPKPGLWQEASTEVDGVKVRVLRDTTSGNFNVCYVASWHERADINGPAPAIAVAISCVPEKKP